MRRYLGNLDFEVELARASARRADARAHGVPGLDLPRDVLALSSALATLLRVFLDEGDRLWLPHPVDPRRMAPVSGIPEPVLETGPFERLPPAADALAWGETRATESLRAGTRGAAPPSAAPAAPRPAIRFLEDEEAACLPYAERLWELPRASAETAERANDRRFALEIARSIGAALPGATEVASVRELEAHLASGGTGWGSEAWVLKAPFSSAGRLRLLGRGPKLARASAARAERLFEAFEHLVFEPWVERLADFGRSGLVGDGAVEILPAHRAIVDRRGGYLGTEVPLRRPVLSSGEAEVSDRALEEVALRLHALGYRGPFTVDFFRHRSPAGHPRLHPLGEINARASFGLAARAFSSRLGLARRAESARLRVEPGRDARIPEDGSSAIAPLLLPEAGARGAAWLEIAGGGAAP